MRARWARTLAIPICAAYVTLAVAAPGTPPAGYTLQRVSDAIPAASLSGVSQLAFKPGDTSHLYAVRSNTNGAVTRFDYDLATGLLSNPFAVASGLPTPYGLAFLGSDLYVSLNAVNDGRITRLRDLNLDGQYEDRSDFVRDVPRQDHGIDQLQISGVTLYAGIGTNSNSARTDCESIYTGTIARIADLTQIDYAGGANYLPSATEFVNTAPVDGYLRRYAYGVRNPFGLRLDAQGRVWVSDNGASTYANMATCKNFAIDTPDLIYRDVPQGAKGNFPPPGYSGGGGATMTAFSTVTTHAAVTGFAWLGVGPDAGRILLAEYGASNQSNPAGHRIEMIDPTTGTVSPFITGFAGPIDIIPDTYGRMLIADIVTPAIYLLTPPGLLGIGPGHPTRPDAGARIVRIAPNPSKATITIDYSLSRASRVTVRIADVEGREIALLDPGSQAAGTHSIRWSLAPAAKPLGAGVYFCRLETALGIVVGAFVHMR